MILATSPYLPIAASAIGTIFIGFGINAMVNPRGALSFFELQYPISPKDKKHLDLLSVVYGVRDIFIGVAIYAAAYYGDRKTLGWIMLAAGSVAGVDGAACRFLVGKGHMNHWSYAPMLIAVGGALLGAFDQA